MINTLKRYLPKLEDVLLVMYGGFLQFQFAAVFVNSYTAISATNVWMAVAGICAACLNSYCLISIYESKLMKQYVDLLKKVFNQIRNQ